METQLTWYGQSAFKIVTPSGNVLLIDPWLTNPVYKRGKEEIAALKRVELILITHGHSDHVGDAVEIAKRTRAKLVATYDLGDAMVKSLGYPAELAETDTIGHFGGELTLLNGDVKVLFVRAHHGSGITVDDESGARYGGSPGGLVITIRAGPLSTTRVTQICFPTWRWCRGLTRSTLCSFALAIILRWDRHARLKR